MANLYAHDDNDNKDFNDLDEFGHHLTPYDTQVTPWRGPRWPLGYPGGYPRFPMTTLCSIQTPSSAKVSFSLQTEQQLHMTPMSTKRPRFQF